MSNHLIGNKSDKLCNITDITERMSQLKSIFPSWDNAYLKDLAEKGCDKLAVCDIQEVSKAAIDAANQFILKTYSPPSWGDALYALVMAIGIISAYYLIKRFIDFVHKATKA